MPAELVSNEAIPNLAARIDSPAMLRVLRHLQTTGFILNGDDVGPDTAGILQRLTDLGLVDAGYNGETAAKPFLWTSNGNGSRVLRYIEVGPLRHTLESRLRVHPRAQTSLASLSDWDQAKVLSATESLQASNPASWSTETVVRLGEDKPVYLVRIPPDLRAFIRIMGSGDVELFDIAREETLKLFLERERAAAGHR
jgi:hypothetical protein